MSEVDFLYQRHCAMQARQNRTPMSFAEWTKAKKEFEQQGGGKER